VISDRIGVVAIGRNEGQRLVGCLVSVRAVTKAVIYVDSGSTDDSVETAERLGVSVFKLDLAQPFTAARARNEGFAALKAVQPKIQFVQFIDGDCELVSDWPHAALSFLEKRSDVAVICGRRRERYPELSEYNHLCDIEWNTPIGETKACGGDSIMRVSAFEVIGGFRSQLIAGEEPELCLRLRERGWKIWRLDAEMTRHDAAILRFEQWWLRVVRSGHAYAEVWWLHRGSRYAIFGKEIARAAIWGGLVPLFLILGALVHPTMLVGFVLYPLQIGRIAMRQGMSDRQSWAYALFMTVSKFAELQGMLKYLWRRWNGTAIQLIEYR
jgi:glycosyltransferase involved in cell wall biosynthesis